MTSLLVREIPSTSVVGKNTVRDQLISAGIVPFTNSSVKQYKKEMVKRHPPSFWYRFWMKKFPSGRSLEDLVFDIGPEMIVFPAILLAVLSGAGVAVRSIWALGPLGSIAFWIVVSSTLFCALFLAALMLQGTYAFLTLKGPARWSCHALKLSKLEIPPEVVAVINKVRVALPGRSIWIDEFTQNRVLLDPFVHVTDEKGESVYIAQWDEVGFNIP